MHVVHAGVGGIQFGVFPEHGIDFEASYPRMTLDDLGGGDPRFGTLRQTVAALTGMAALNVDWQSFYTTQMALRRKVVVNAVINSLTALMDCKNGAVLAHQSGRAICERVCLEAANAFRAQHAADLRQSGTSSRDRPVEFPYQLTKDALIQEVERVAQVTANNYSSMLMDIKRGRTTEIGFMNGYLCDLGKRHNVQMPTNSLLMRLIDLRTRIPVHL